MQERKQYLDGLRLIAVTMVIYHHLPAYALNQPDTPGQPLYAFFAMLVQTGVPLFWMISGALLLGREESLRDLLKKRVCRMLVILPVFYLGLYCLRLAHDAVLYGAPFAFSAGDFIAGLFSNALISQDAASYWFLYAYLGYLLMLPFLRSVAKQLRRSQVLLLLGLHVGMKTVYPLVALLIWSCGGSWLTITGEFYLPFAVVDMLFYPLLGFWLDREADVARWSRKTRILIPLAAAAGLGISCLTREALGERLGLTLFTWSAAIAIFLSVKGLYAGRKREPKARKVSPGSLTFGIYLLDPWLKLTLYGAYDRLTAGLPVFLSSLFWIPVSLLVGGTITFLLKKIPGFGKWL